MSSTPPTRPRPASPCHYELLQLPATATPQQLRQAFRLLSKRYHPDTTTLPQAQAELAFQRLQKAYAVLSDPTRRQAYDSQRLQPPAAPVMSTSRSVPASRPDGVRRALSGGEWFALLLLAVALVLSLILGIGLAWARGTALVRQPSWWDPPQPLPTAVGLPAAASALSDAPSDAPPEGPAGAAGVDEGASMAGAPV